MALSLNYMYLLFNYEIYSRKTEKALLKMILVLLIIHKNYYIVYYPRV